MALVAGLAPTWNHKGEARTVRPNRSWLLTDFPGKGVFTRPRPGADIALALMCAFT
jgi:hypothetical protein